MGSCRCLSRDPNHLAATRLVTDPISRRLGTIASLCATRLACASDLGRWLTNNPTDSLPQHRSTLTLEMPSVGPRKGFANPPAPGPRLALAPRPGARVVVVAG